MKIDNVDIKPKVNKKKSKKAVNYYLSIELIDKIKSKAKDYNMKDSVFIEEILSQILDSM